MNTLPLDPLPQDRLVAARFASQGLALVYADTTAAAHALEDAHLSGPVASRALGEALAAAAILSAEGSEEQECVSFELAVDGPIRGVFAEASAEGRLRGMTKKKLFDDLDGLDAPPSGAEVFGTRGEVRVLRSVPGRILATGRAAVPSPSVAHALAAHYASSLQRRAGCLLAAPLGADHRVAYARGVLVERMPDGSSDAFVAVLEKLSEKGADALLGSAPSLRALCDALALPKDGVFTDLRALAFGCRCSREKVAATLAALPKADREEMAREGKPVTVHCHLCGKAYVLPPPSAE